MPQRMDSCRERGRCEAMAGTEASEGSGEESQTHIEEQATAKRVVGDLLLLGSPGAIQIAVPNHSVLGQAGVNVESQVPGGPHLEVDGKAGGREGDESQEAASTWPLKGQGAPNGTPGSEGEGKLGTPTSVSVLYLLPEGGT